VGTSRLDERGKSRVEVGSRGGVRSLRGGWSEVPFHRSVKKCINERGVSR